MSKILSQSGNSLADIYDVEGSIAGIEELETRELPIVHEMAATIFSERYSGSIIRVPSTDLDQNETFDIVTVDVGAESFSRILGIQVIADTASRLSTVSVSVREPGSSREIPIWAWDLNEAAINFRIADEAAAAAVELLVGQQVASPSMLVGNRQSNPIDEIAFRGLSTGFGAGTVEAILLLYIGFAQDPALGSRGLPMPGW